jgi:hypothetical protein
MAANPAAPASEVPAFTVEELRPNIDHIEIDDGKPVDNRYSERQMRLLTHPLNTTWRDTNGGRPFVAMANVGVFFAVRKPPIVPDVLLSVDVSLPEDINVRLKHTLAYLVWEYGKVPDVAVEIVSNTQGGELTTSSFVTPPWGCRTTSSGTLACGSAKVPCKGLSWAKPRSTCLWKSYRFRK